MYVCMWALLEERSECEGHAAQCFFLAERGWLPKPLQQCCSSGCCWTEELHSSWTSSCERCSCVITVSCFSFNAKSLQKSDQLTASVVFFSFLYLRLCMYQRRTWAVFTVGDLDALDLPAQICGLHCLGRWSWVPFKTYRGAAFSRRSGGPGTREPQPKKEAGGRAAEFQPLCLRGRSRKW